MTGCYTPTYTLQEKSPFSGWRLFRHTTKCTHTHLYVCTMYAFLSVFYLHDFLSTVSQSGIGFPTLGRRRDGVGGRSLVSNFRETSPAKLFPRHLYSIVHMHNVDMYSNGKTSLVHYRTLSFFTFRFLKKRKFAFFRHFKYKITSKPVRFASILWSFEINQFASLR